MRKKTYNKKEVERLIAKSGWTLVRQTGSHKIYTNAKGEHLTMRCHKPNKMIICRLIKENQLVVE